MKLPRRPQRHVVDSSAEWLPSLVDPETTASPTERLLAPKLANGKPTKQSSQSSSVRLCRRASLASSSPQTVAIAAVASTAASVRFGDSVVSQNVVS